MRWNDLPPQVSYVSLLTPGHECSIPMSVSFCPIFDTPLTPLFPLLMSSIALQSYEEIPLFYLFFPQFLGEGGERGQDKIN